MEHKIYTVSERLTKSSYILAQITNGRKRIKIDDILS